MLHWHLTDDKGWRIEIIAKTYECGCIAGTQNREMGNLHFGAVRRKSNVRGYYTQDDS